MIPNKDEVKVVIVGDGAIGIGHQGHAAQSLCP